MNLSVFQLVKLGKKYMELWPKKPELAVYFQEYRSIQMSRLAYQYFPAVAAVVFVIQLYFGTMSALPQAIFYAIFIGSMPIQAFVMLGVKADKFLPPALSSWYKEGVARVNEQGGEIKLSIHKPRYLDLAKLLNLTYRSKKF